MTDVQVGVAAGRLRSGTYGHRERRTFCCLGDAVNLAARLMTRAPAGGIWVHGDVAEAAGERFVWDELPDDHGEGPQAAGAGPRAARPRGPRRPRAAGSRPLNPMVGRDAELARLRALWQAAGTAGARSWSCRPRPAPASPGSSASSSAELVADGVPVARGEATPLATQASYAGWRDVWADLLGLDPDSRADRPR